jgi:hypothetical protein
VGSVWIEAWRAGFIEWGMAEWAKVYARGGVKSTTVGGTLHSGLRRTRENVCIVAALFRLSVI